MEVVRRPVVIIMTRIAVRYGEHVVVWESHNERRRRVVGTMVLVSVQDLTI